MPIQAIDVTQIYVKAKISVDDIIEQFVGTVEETPVRLLINAIPPEYKESGGLYILFDVMGYGSQFGLNEIPVCNLVIPLGIRTDNANSISSIHFLLDKIKHVVPIYVSLYYIPTFGSEDRTQFVAPVIIVDQKGNFKLNEKWREILIFEGRIAGVGIRQQFSTAECIISVSHWLVDLAFSSCLSRLMSPACPADVTFPAHLREMLNTGVINQQGVQPPAGSPQKIPEYQFRNVVATRDVLTKDLWGTDYNENFLDPTGRIVNPPLGQQVGLKGFLRLLASTDRFEINSQRANEDILDLLGKCNNKRPVSNIESLNAIKRFEPFAIYNEIDQATLKIIERQDNGYEFGVAVAVDQNIVGNDSLINNLSSDIPRVNYANTSMWDVLIGKYCANYFLGLVPMVSKAMIVPFTSGLQFPAVENGQSYPKTIFSNEITSFNWDVGVHRPLRGIGLISKMNSFTGFMPGSPTSRNINGVGALFDTCKPGMILFKNAPAWLGESLVYLSKYTTNAKTPTTGTSIKVIINGQQVEIPDIFSDITYRSFLVDYCQLLYLQEVLKHRTLTVGTKLRFDIAPGTLVRIEIPQNEFIKQQIANRVPFGLGDVIKYLYGIVSRVSIQINSESNTALTSFSIGFVKVGTENIDTDLAVSKNALWKNVFYGAPLISTPIRLV